MAIQEISSINKVDKLEEFFGQDINDKRFIPYIQLHEFEALLFSSNRGFEKYEEEKIYFKTKEIIESFKNPEDINSSPQTSPSKRLLAINPKYNKVIDGNIIALEIGIQTILKKCPRFNFWLNNLISKVKEKEWIKMLFRNKFWKWFNFYFELLEFDSNKIELDSNLLKSNSNFL